MSMRLDISPVKSGLSVTAAVANDFVVKAESRNARLDVVCKMDGVLPQEPVPVPVVTYAVTTTLENVTSNAPETIDEGNTLSVSLTGTGGNKVQENTVVVTMGGVDVTSTSYDHSTKKVTIANVTGDISITAVGKPYDAEVEYLQSDSTAYIDTGIKGASSIKIEAEFTTLNGYSGTTAIFGSRVANNNAQYTLQFYLDQVGSGNNYWRWGFGSYYNTVSHNKTNGNFTLSNKSAARTMVISGDHNLSVTCTNNSFTNSYNIYLFGMNSGGSLGGNNNTQYVRIKWFKIYSNSGSTLERNYIPVRDNGVGYLYDKVSGTLFGNANSSGAFTFGNDKTT